MVTVLLTFPFECVLRCCVGFLAQYFWFRHIFLLSEGDRCSIQAMTVQLLADKKLEVQDLAKSTLAGLIKVCLFSECLQVMPSSDRDV